MLVVCRLPLSMNVKVGVTFRNKWERSTMKMMFLVPKLTRIQLCDTFWFVKIYTPNCLLLNLCLQSPQHLGSTGWQWGIFQSLLRVSRWVVSDSLCPWTVAYQAPLSMGFSRQKYWSGLPFPSPGDLPNPGIKPWSPVLQADSLPSEPTGKPLT